MTAASGLMLTGSEIVTGRPAVGATGPRWANRTLGAIRMIAHQCFIAALSGIQMRGSPG